MVFLGRHRLSLPGNNSFRKTLVQKGLAIKMNGGTTGKSISISTAAFLLSLLIGLSCSTWASDTAGSRARVLRAARVTIFTADAKHKIGYGEYTMLPSQGTEILRGENKYFDGERDLELERLKHDLDRGSLVLLSYKHSFFSADQSLQRLEILDAKSGTASCQTYASGQVDEHRAKLSPPPDTYAGAALIVIIGSRLRQATQNMTFHLFICIPKPRIIVVNAVLDKSQARWLIYPGSLARVEIQPDLGLLGFLVTPFISKMYAWFDPRDNWNYAGALYYRFYGGPCVLTVRDSEAQRPSDQRP